MVKESENVSIKNAFNRFIQAQSCSLTFSEFLELCNIIDLDYPPCFSSNDHASFYPTFKKKLSCSWKAESLFSKLDKRFYGKEYFGNSDSDQSKKKKVGEKIKILIVGAGPCGLRTAIEMACLGAKVVILEKRDKFSRNNILHLWPFLITDLKTLGAKKIYGRFCAGAIDHISIRQLQLILLKVSLILGVEIIFNVSFEGLIPPIIEDNQFNKVAKRGWTAAVSSSNLSVSNYEFDVIVGADGKRNTLEGFNRKEFRAKLAIGLTVNFINHKSDADARVEEMSGVASLYNPEFFKNLYKTKGIDLENIVYYKGDTHYFVMTAKKHSLLAKGVIKQDFDDTASLLHHDNIDTESLMTYTREAAQFTTKNQLPDLEFAVNHCGLPDVAMFDFTCMYGAENAALFREVKGRKLLACLVGDSLLESICVYADPKTRYQNIDLNMVKPPQVVKYYVSDREVEVNEAVPRPTSLAASPYLRSRRFSLIDANMLLSWSQASTDVYDDVTIDDFSSSWKDGRALCAIIHRHQPSLIDFESLDPHNVEENNQLAFDVAEKHLGIPPVVTGEEMAKCDEVDALVMVSYLSQFYEVFKTVSPSNESPALHDLNIPTAPKEMPNDSHALKVTSPIVILTKLTQIFKQKTKSIKEKLNQSDPEEESPAEIEKTTPSTEQEATQEEETTEEFNADEDALTVANATVKLRPKKTGVEDSPSLVHKRASDMISCLSNQLISQFQQNSPNVVITPTQRQVNIAEIPVPSSSQCCFCKKKLHVLDRQSAEGVFFHRQCFVCFNCEVTLHYGSYLYDEETGKFFCGVICLKEAQNTRIDGSIYPTITRKESDTPANIEDKAELYRTPERIELENIRLAVANDLEVWSEEEIVKHNLMGGVSASEASYVEEDGESSEDEIEELEEEYDLLYDGSRDSPTALSSSDELSDEEGLYEVLTTNQPDNERKRKTSEKSEAKTQPGSRDSPTALTSSDDSSEEEGLDAVLTIKQSDNEVILLKRERRTSEESEAETQAEAENDLRCDVASLDGEVDGSESIKISEAPPTPAPQYRPLVVCDGRLTDDENDKDDDSIDDDDDSDEKVSSDTAPIRTSPVYEDVIEFRKAAKITDDQAADAGEMVLDLSSEMNCAQLPQQLDTQESSDPPPDKANTVESTRDPEPFLEQLHEGFVPNPTTKTPSSQTSKKRSLPSLPKVVPEANVALDGQDAIPIEEREKQIKKQIDKFKARSLKKNAPTEQKALPNENVSEVDSVTGSIFSGDSEVSKARVKRTLPTPPASGKAPALDDADIKDRRRSARKHSRTLPTPPNRGIEELQPRNKRLAIKLSRATRKTEKAARRLEKLEAQNRLYKAQTIQRQLEEIEVKQRNLEERGIKLETILRSNKKGEEDPRMMQNWFELVQEKNTLLRSEYHLMIRKRQLQLDEEHSHLERELRRCRASGTKSSHRCAEEMKLYRLMIDVLEQRDQLNVTLEEQDYKAKDEDIDLDAIISGNITSFSKQVI